MATVLKQYFPGQRCACYYVVIPLDIFRKNQQNKGINNKRDAWLALFSSDDPETVVRLIEKYPEFQKIYEESYEICRNTERVMEMFSKELYELDRNTVQYMIDEMQDTIDAQKDVIKKLEAERTAEITKSEKKYDQSIRNTINLLRSLNLPEQKIIQEICKSHEIDEDEIQKYI